MAAKNIKPNARRGRREMRDITVETYSRVGDDPSPVLPKSSAWESGQTAITLFPSASVLEDSPSSLTTKTIDSAPKVLSGNQTLPLSSFLDVKVTACVTSLCFHYRIIRVLC